MSQLLGLVSPSAEFISAVRANLPDELFIEYAPLPLSDPNVKQVISDVIAEGRESQHDIIKVDEEAADEADVQAAAETTAPRTAGRLKTALYLGVLIPYTLADDAIVAPVWRTADHALEQTHMNTLAKEAISAGSLVGISTGAAILVAKMALAHRRALHPGEFMHETEKADVDVAPATEPREDNFLVLLEIDEDRAEQIEAPEQSGALLREVKKNPAVDYEKTYAVGVPLRVHMGEIREDKDIRIHALKYATIGQLVLYKTLDFYGHVLGAGESSAVFYTGLATFIAAKYTEGLYPVSRAVNIFMTAVNPLRLASQASDYLKTRVKTGKLGSAPAQTSPVTPQDGLGLSA